MAEKVGKSNLRFRMPDKLKEQWESVCRAQKISQQDAITSLIEWFVGQDAITRLTILGQMQGEVAVGNGQYKRAASDAMRKGVK